MWLSFKNMSGRPKIFEEEEVISKAVALFWLKGYEASSTEELLVAMGIGKGSFYLAFKGGKRELFEKVLTAVSKRELKQLRDKLAIADNQVEVIKNLFRSIGLASKETNEKGCLFGHTIADFSARDLALTNIAAKHLQQLEEIFHQVILQAREKEQLKTNEDPLLLASHLITMWNGLGITRRISSQSGSLTALIEMQLKVLL